MKMNREQGLQWIEQTRIIAIVRGVEEQHIADVAQALLDGGVRVMEITLNTPGAPEMITKLQKQFGDNMYIGAGTVLDMDDAKKAIEAGASYLVTPNMDVDVIHYAVEQSIPIFPGAMTPTEIVKAWKAGATAVKVFPGASLGLGYIKELQGPLNHIPMVAVGGVNEDNIAQFILAGCYGVGIGGSLVNLKEITAGNFSWISDKAAKLIANLQVKQ
jgi:2-dehydro-3-deoxyphosphogluconate aldolase/(4S)-4-hydroxy-2-oxoglutarate aldolase